MSAIRTAVAVAELTIAVVGVAVTVSRHPLVRAGVRAMPQEIKDAAAEAVLDAAYRAGAVARRVLPRRLVG